MSAIVTLPLAFNGAALNLKGCGEFAAENRPSGWNVWLTFAISQMASTSTVTPTRRVVTK